MGVDTCTIECSEIVLKPGTESAALAAALAIATATGCEGSTVEAMHEHFGIEEGNDFPSFGLADSRPPYFYEATLPHGFHEGIGPQILAEAIAPYVMPGCWWAYESDGDAWCIAFDGERVHFPNILPDLPGVPLRRSTGSGTATITHTPEATE